MRRMYQSTISLFVGSWVLLTGCVPASRIHETRMLASVEAGRSIDRDSARLLRSNAELDEASERFAASLEERGFELLNESDGYGLVPWTGPTKTLLLALIDNRDMHARIKMTKSRFTCVFEHLESEPRSDDYRATEAELRVIDVTAHAVHELAATMFPERAIRVTAVHHANRTGRRRDE